MAWMKLIGDRKMYQYLKQIEKNRNEVLDFGIKKLYEIDIQKEFSKSEIKKLLFDDIWKPFFIQYFIDNITKFISVFSIPEALDLLERLNISFLTDEYLNSIILSKYAVEFFEYIYSSKEKHKFDYKEQLSKVDCLKTILLSNYRQYKENPKIFRTYCGKIIRRNRCRRILKNK